MGLKRLPLMLNRSSLPGLTRHSSSHEDGCARHDVEERFNLSGSRCRGDPIEDGLVASLAQPGGNLTGLTFLAPELTAKRLQQLKDEMIE